MCSILNKITPQTYEVSVAKILELKIDDARKLIAAVDMIFAKAVSRPNCVVLYANLCQVLADTVSICSIYYSLKGELRANLTPCFFHIMIIITKINRCTKFHSFLLSLREL